MNSRLYEKITGALTGYAIGDALGLGTEFMTADEAKSYYPDGLDDYSQIIMDAHRSQWGAGNWTHDTHFVTMLAENIMADHGIDCDHFARRMCDWYGEGHYDVPAQIRAVLSHPLYREDPCRAARETWKKMGRQAETSSVLGIAAISGMSAKDPVEEPLDLCRRLQCGPMSLGSTSAIARAANALLWEDRIMSEQEIIDIVSQFSPEIKPYVHAAAVPETISDISVDDEDTLWMVRKSMASVLWAVWHFDSFEEALKGVVMLAGDADTNASCAGALLGLKFGRDAIPRKWIDGLLEREYIEDVADRFARYLISNNADRQ